MSKNTLISTIAAIILLIACIGAYIAFGSSRVVAPTPSSNATSTTDVNSSSLITEAEARAIAEKSCIKGGDALAKGSYNPYSATWWFDANLNAARPGCFPACVVNEKTKTAEINWRCTGALPPQ